jgi:hypothetical protein
MNYKIKFEIKYPDESLDIIRDLKIDIALSNITTEICSSSPLTPPNRKDTITLGDSMDFEIVNIRHKLDSSLYTIIVEVESIELNQKIKEKRALQEKISISEKLEAERKSAEYFKELIKRHRKVDDGYEEDSSGTIWM